MASRKKKARQTKGPSATGESTSGRRERTRRTDSEKIQLVRRVLESDNQSAEIKRSGIYPNQFYEWKKKFADQLGLGSTSKTSARDGRKAVKAAGNAAEEARAFLNGRAELLDRLRSQRTELDELIAQLESPLGR
jgi:transposase-like protein